MPQTANYFGLSNSCYIGGKPRSSSYPFYFDPGNLCSFGIGEPISFLLGTINNLVAATSQPVTEATQLILGVFQSITYQPAQPGNAPATYPFWLSGTQTFNRMNPLVSIVVDPMQVYTVQVNGNVSWRDSGSTFNLGGMNNINPSTGLSGVYMENTPFPAGTGDFGHVKMLGLAPTTAEYPQNSWDDPFPIVQVVLNNTHFKVGQFSVGQV